MRLTKRHVPQIAMFVAVVGLSLVSAFPAAAAASPALLSATSEAAVQGGKLTCDVMLGIAAGLGISIFSPCSIVCATGAWYALVAAGIMGC